MNPDSDLMQKIIHIRPGSEFVTMLSFIGIGALLTAIFQSSSAMITLTMVLAIERWIPFEMAAAMVLGENIGTTSTALFASLVANNSAKRAALVHLFFNVFGVIWAAALFKPITIGIHLLTGTDPSPSAEMPKEILPYSLAILHTGFNLVNTMLLIGFTSQLVKLTYVLIPSRGKKKEKSQLRFIESHISSVSEISILQARKEVMQMSRIVQEMFGIIPLLLIEKDAVVYSKLLKRVEKLEGKIDRMEDDTVHYLSKVAQGKLSRKGTEELQALLRCIDEIESIGDACYKMSSIIRSKNDMKLYFIQDLRDRLQILFSRVEESLEVMHRHLSADLFKIRLEDAEAAEEKINRYRDELREEHFKDVREEKYSHQAGVVYVELITQCEKVGDYAMNVTRSLVSAR
jgi:phosphate:Na+ symporter